MEDHLSHNAKILLRFMREAAKRGLFSQQESMMRETMSVLLTVLEISDEEFVQIMRIIATESKENLS